MYLKCLLLSKQQIIYSRFTIWLFVESFVIPHIQCHVTHLTFETLFVPDLKNIIIIRQVLCSKANTLILHGLIFFT
jgi:hypothetical protein